MAITCYRCKQPYADGRCGCQDGITLVCADCREVLPQLEAGSFDLVLTDPPYGIGADTNQRKRADKQHGNAVAPSRDYGDTEWDTLPPDGWTVTAMRTVAKQAVIWGGNYFSLPPSSCWLVWDKDNGNNGYADCELAWTNLDCAVRKFKWKWQGMLQEKAGVRKEQRYHPTQKPVALMNWCIALADDPKTVIDPMAGVGTTGRACKDLGRRCLMIELEEKYCAIAAQRLRQNCLF